jgi:DNA-binding beta-propeller fold protein YncE
MQERRSVMTRLFAIVVFPLALLAGGCSDEGPSGPAPEPLAGRAFVVNSLGGTLSIVGRGPDGRLVAQNDVAELGPGSTAVTLAVGEGVVAVPDGGTNRLLIFEEATLERRCSAELPTGSSPTAVALAGGDAYVSLLLADGVARVDLATCAVEQIGIVGAAPVDLELLGRTLMVVVGNIDLRSGAFPVPRLGQSYVAFVDAGTLAAIDTASTGGTNAQFAALDQEGELLVVNSGEFGAGNSTVAVLDPVTRRLVAGPFPIGDFAADLAVSPDNRAYITSFNDGLYVFDATSNRVLRSTENPLFAPGPAGQPRGSSGVAVDRFANIVSVFFGEGATPGQVFLFDATEALVDSVTVGLGPFGTQLEAEARPR